MCDVCLTSRSGGHRLGSSDPVCCCMALCRPPVDVLLCDAKLCRNVCNCLGPVSDLPSSRRTSLLEGLEFTPAASATTERDLVHIPNYSFSFYV